MTLLLGMILGTALLVTGVGLGMSMRPHSSDDVSEEAPGPDAEVHPLWSDVKARHAAGRDTAP